MILVFVKFQPKKYLNKVLLVPSLIFLGFLMKLCMLTDLRILILNTTLDFWNSSQKYPIKAILFPNLRIFIFVSNFVYRKIWWCGYKIPPYSSFFEFQPKNAQIRQFWFYILKGFFCKKYYILTNWKCWSQAWQ